LNRRDAKGDLFLVVDVLFPEDGFFTDPPALEGLRKLLPGPPPAIEADETDEVPFEIADIDDIGGQEAHNAWEDDDEGPQQAQCQTQ
jgi:DnaJ family protein A protein 2